MFTIINQLGGVAVCNPIITLKISDYFRHSSVSSIIEWEAKEIPLKLIQANPSSVKAMKTETT